MSRILLLLVRFLTCSYFICHCSVCVLFLLLLYFSFCRLSQIIKRNKSQITNAYRFYLPSCLLYSHTCIHPCIYMGICVCMYISLGHFTVKRLWSEKLNVKTLSFNFIKQPISSEFSKTFRFLLF